MKKMFFLVSVFILITSTMIAQVSATTKGDASEKPAKNDLKSTTKGFLPPHVTLPQISAMSNPANGTIVFCTTDEKFYAYITSTKTWKEMLFGTGTIASCGLSVTITHVAGPVAPVTKKVNYGTVNNVPGEPSKCWITSNLGADHQATAVNDDNEPSAGWYWQFNHKQGYKHDGSTITPNTGWISSISETSDWLKTNDPCAIELGNGWRIPTTTEWINVHAAGGWIDWNNSWNSVLDRKSTRLNSSHSDRSRMPSSA